MRSACLAGFSSSSPSPLCISCAMSRWSREGCLEALMVLGLMPSACRVLGELDKDFTTFCHDLLAFLDVLLGVEDRRCIIVC